MKQRAMALALAVSPVNSGKVLDISACLCNDDWRIGPVGRAIVKIYNAAPVFMRDKCQLCLWWKTTAFAFFKVT